MALLMSTRSAVVVTAQVTSPCSGPSPLRRRPAMRAAAHPPARSARMPLTIHQSPAPMPNALADGVSPEIGSLIVAPIATPRRPRSTMMAVAMAAPAKIAPQETRRSGAEMVCRRSIVGSRVAMRPPLCKSEAGVRRDSACKQDITAVLIREHRMSAPPIKGAIAAAPRTIRHARVGPSCGHARERDAVLSVFCAGESSTRDAPRVPRLDQPPSTLAVDARIFREATLLIGTGLRRDRSTELDSRLGFCSRRRDGLPGAILASSPG